MPHDDTTSQPDPLALALARNAELDRENQELRAKLVAMERQLRRLLRRIVAPANSGKVGRRR